MRNRAGVSLRGVVGQNTKDSPLGFADLPPGVGFEPKDDPLRCDINLLGCMLVGSLPARLPLLRLDPLPRLGRGVALHSVQEQFRVLLGEYEGAVVRVNEALRDGLVEERI